MHYRKPDDYDTFRCLADGCPQNCCSAWQVVIDEESLARYRQMQGTIGERVRGGIDWEEQCFRQKENRLCVMQRPDGLCTLQFEAGEEALCRTCAQYPRHTEEYEGVRELSLALSCPEAARMLLERQTPLSWVEWDDELPEPDPEDDWDDLLYDRMLYARARLIAIAQDRSVPMAERMGSLLASARALQGCADDGDVLLMDEVFENKQQPENAAETAVRLIAALDEMEVLYGETWPGMLAAAKSACEKPGCAQRLARLAEELAVPCEQLLAYFLDVYFCGAYYDGGIFARTAAAVCGTLWIVLLHDVCGIGLQESVRYYMREIYHSDLNPDELLDILDLNA